MENKGQRRSGAAVIVMVLVLGGMAISLLILAGKTSIQLKSFRMASLDIQQCNELIAFGEKILKARHLENPEFTSAIIRLDLSPTVVVTDHTSSQFGIIELARIANSGNEQQHGWTITAYIGLNEGHMKQASRAVILGTPTK